MNRYFVIGCLILNLYGNAQHNFTGSVTTTLINSRKHATDVFRQDINLTNDTSQQRKPKTPINSSEWYPIPESISTENTKTVLLDYYFNNEYRKNAGGNTERFHYTWQDTSYSGYSVLGHIFQDNHVSLAQLETAPTSMSLKKAAIYIIVDPDTEKETANPHFIQESDADVIFDWVKAGGVLLMMGNDSGNAEFLHFNKLSEKFGIHFNENCVNKVKNDQFEMGAFDIKPGDNIFSTTRKIFIKELSTLQLNPPATAHYRNSKGDVIMAISKLGKGTVFAVGDPWLYNEYVDSRRLPVDFENYHAASDLVKWLLQQVPVISK